MLFDVAGVAILRRIDPWMEPASCQCSTVNRCGTETPLYWQFNYANRPKVALRSGDWKILAPLVRAGESARGADITPESTQAIKTAELESFELYDLKSDISESADQAALAPTSEREVLEA